MNYFIEALQPPVKIAPGLPYPFRLSLPHTIGSRWESTTRFI